MHDIKLIMTTTAVTVPAIVGTGVELEDDEPVIGDSIIAIKLLCHLLNILRLVTETSS